jgi:hypothetical protein
MRRPQFQPLVEHKFGRRFDLFGRKGRVVNSD